jgi:hypothetical protein
MASDGSLGWHGARAWPSGAPTPGLVVRSAPARAAGVSASVDAVAGALLPERRDDGVFLEGHALRRAGVDHGGPHPYRLVFETAQVAATQVHPRCHVVVGSVGAAPLALAGKLQHLVREECLLATARRFLLSAAGAGTSAVVTCARLFGLGRDAPFAWPPITAESVRRRAGANAHGRRTGDAGMRDRGCVANAALALVAP